MNDHENPKKQISNSLSKFTFFIDLTKSFKYPTVGYNNLSVFLNYRFRSLPAIPVLKFPIITPSGFIIGTITKYELSKM